MFFVSKSGTNATICTLIHKQRRLASSTIPSERFRVLWLAAILDDSLMHCTNHEIGDLMLIVQDQFRIFDAEFAICYHARKRLLLKPYRRTRPDEASRHLHPSFQR
jgi:hypothetical protein